MMTPPRHGYTKTFHLNLCTRLVPVEPGDPNPLPDRPTSLTVEVTAEDWYLGEDGHLVTDPTFVAFSEYLHTRFGKRLEDALQNPTVGRIAQHLYEWIAGTSDVPLVRVRVTEWTINPESATYGY